MTTTVQTAGEAFKKGLISILMGDSDMAADNFETVATYFDEQDDLDEVNTSFNKGLMYLIIGDMGKVVDEFQPVATHFDEQLGLEG